MMFKQSPWNTGFNFCNPDIPKIIDIKKKKTPIRDFLMVFLFFFLVGNYVYLTLNIIAVQRYADRVEQENKILKEKMRK